MEAVLAVPIAVGFGYWADTHFGTSPRYLLVGAVIGFCAFVLRLVRMGPGADESPADDEGSTEAGPTSNRQNDDTQGKGETKGTRER